MKSLLIQTAGYQDIEKEFTGWLETLSYAKDTVTIRKSRIRELFHYLENNSITSIKKITGENLDNFIDYLKQRENLVYGAGLSNATINQGIETINIFLKFLKQSKNHDIKPIGKQQRMEELYKPRTILSLEEVEYLYRSTYIKREHVKNHLAYGQRDRAMLGIYYGCGLRKQEGENLDTGDILISRKLVFVRTGKGNKERYVPITGRNLLYIIEYLEYGHKWFLSQKSILTGQPRTEAFFIGRYGNRNTGQSLSKRLETLVQQSESASLRSKKPGLHSLRHSIATHLLQSGMDIELISKFLGHNSLVSTQIYTHIVNKL